ncbi:hypothetical protein D9M72_616250 [compost metagenome]
MACGAPLAKHDDFGRQNAAQRVAMLDKPCGQPGKLPGMGLGQILPTVLRSQTAIGRKREAEIGAIKLFLHYHVACQQGLGFVR